MNRSHGEATKDQIELEVAPTLDAVFGVPVLVTENEVVFSTAAAASLRPTTKRGWPTATGPWRCRRYPSRCSFLDHSWMRREMGRL